MVDGATAQVLGQLIDGLLQVAYTVTVPGGQSLTYSVNVRKTGL